MTVGENLVEARGHDEESCRGLMSSGCSWRWKVVALQNILVLRLAFVEIVVLPPDTWHLEQISQHLSSCGKKDVDQWAITVWSKVEEMYQSFKVHDSQNSDIFWTKENFAWIERTEINILTKLLAVLYCSVTVIYCKHQKHLKHFCFLLQNLYFWTKGKVSRNRPTFVVLKWYKATILSKINLDDLIGWSFVYKSLSRATSWVFSGKICAKQLIC